MSTPVRVLVFGKNGQVGSNLARIFSDYPLFEVIAADIDEIDLTKTRNIEKFIIDSAPNWVINASAHTAVDRAENEEALSFLLNCDAPEAMARTCSVINARFVHYSTDYVFDGLSKQPYLETDTANPQGVYGRSKLAGELAVSANLPDAIILRTAWVYSRQGNNFVNTMLRLADERSELKVVSDQVGSPTLADDLAELTVNIVNRISTGEYVYHGGIYHATGGGHTSWYEFCKKIMEIAGRNDIRIRPITTSEYPTEAPRPLYSVLSNQKLYETYKQRLPHWVEALARCLDSSHPVHVPVGPTP